VANRKPRIRKAVDSGDKTAKSANNVSAADSKSESKAKAPASSSGRLQPQIPGAGGVKRVLRWLAPSYFVNSWREVRQVTWPSRRETWRLTAAVFVFAIIFGGLVAGVDKGLDEIFKKVILK